MSNLKSDPEYSYAPLPFWTIRNFADSLFAVIAGFGFYKLAEALIAVKNQLEYIREAAPTKPFEFLQKVIESPELVSDFHIAAFLVIILVIACDDYLRARIITYMSPCRSIGRIGLDILISFLFGITAWLVTIKSSFIFLSLSIAFFSGAIWANLAEKQMEEWAAAGEPRDSVEIRNWHKVKDKVSFNRRLWHISLSHTITGFILLIAYTVVSLYDSERKYWGFYPYSVLAYYMILEAYRYCIEEAIVEEAKIETGRANFRVLKTMVWIPSLITDMLSRRGHARARKNFDARKKKEQSNGIL